MKRIALLVMLASLVAACGGPGPTDQHSTARPTREPSPSPQPVTPRPAASDLAELPLPNASIAPGRYTKSAFKPSIGFTIGDGWTAQQTASGFFDIQHDPGTPDVIAVQFANVNAPSLQSAMDAVTDRDHVQIVEAGSAFVDGHSGFRAVVETTDPGAVDPAVFRPVLDTTAGPISIASGRRLLIMLFDTEPGVLAILVGGSIANWDETLKIAQPVLDSVTIAD